MRPFKFLRKEIEDEDDEFNYASWTFVNPANIEEHNYSLVQNNCYGIRSFLHLFPAGHIVGVVSITGPNGVVHSIDNEGIGWGFDITSELIEVVWARFNG